MNEREEAAVFYRTAGEVRCDIRRIKSEIAEARSRLNIRELLVDAIYSAGSVRALLPMLEDILAKSAEALSELDRLQAQLLSLREELHCSL